MPFFVRGLAAGATFRSVPEVSAQQRAALTAALRRVGAPEEVAIALARSATIEPYEDVFMLCLNGNCSQVEDEDEDYLGPVEHLAENAAADNAEAFDRQKRGEPGYSPWWDLPDRRPRG